jgi:serine protease
MSRSRLRLLASAAGLALVFLFTTHGHGQETGPARATRPAPSARREIGDAGAQAATPARLVVDRTAPPAIERGISPLMLHDPTDPQAAVAGRARVDGHDLDRTGASGASYVAGKVIVKFKDGASAVSRIESVRAVSRTAAITARPDYADFDIVKIDPTEDAEAVAQALSARPDVEYAQAAYRIRPQFVPNDRFYNEQWNLPAIDMERAWDIQPSAGSSITVAVLDTGIAYTNATIRFHANAFTDPNGVRFPALGDLTLSFVAATELAPSSRFVSPHDFIWDDNTPLDLDGHGTHVSGTIGQLTNNGSGSTSGDVTNGGGTAGVAFNVKLMPVKVIDTEWDDIFGSPNQGTDDVVARGIRYAADNGAKILNMSIGRTGPPAPAIESALNYAIGKGCFVAIAGGNDFLEGNPTEVIAEIASRVKGAVSVAAVDRNKNHASYSNTGSWIELAAPGGEFQNFGATGGILQQTLDIDLITTFEQGPTAYARTPPRFDALAYFFFTGTSSATPHVSGVAAMLMQQGITDPAAIEAALEHNALDLGDKGRDSTFGFGMVQARDALRGLGLAR